MPLPPEYLEILAQRRTAEEKAARRETRLDLVKTFGLLLVWTTLGLAFIGLAWHVTDPGYARIFLWAGALVWVGGVWATLMMAYHRGLKRGDWE